MPEVRAMVTTARRFIDGQLHFSALVEPIGWCEYWSRHGAHPEINALARKWALLVDRTWNEYRQHNDPLTVDELRMELLRDFEDCEAS